MLMVCDEYPHTKKLLGKLLLVTGEGVHINSDKNVAGKEGGLF